MGKAPMSIAIWFVMFMMPSSVWAFDCAKAYLPVDFVICSDPEVFKANEIHERAWYDARSRLSDVQKRVLLNDQRRWLKEFPLTCGVPAKGKPLPIAPKAAQQCVAQALLTRAEFLRHYPETFTSLQASPVPIKPAPTPQNEVGDVSRTGTAGTDAADTGSTASPIPQPTQSDNTTEKLRQWPDSLNSDALAALQRVLPPNLKDEDWVYRLNGVSQPMIKLAIDGKEYWSGTVCKPHDCHGNMLSFLAAADGSRAAALIAIEGQIQSFGQQSPGEFALLDRLLRLEYRGQINMNAQEQTTAQKIVSSNGSYVDPETTNAQASASKSGRWFNIKGIRLGMILEFLPLQYDGLPVAIPQGNPAARVVRRCNGQQPYVECTTVSFDATGHTEMSVYGVAVNGLRMDYTDVRAAKLAFTEKYGPPAFMHDFGDTMIMQWGGSQDYTNFSMLGDPGILVDNPIGNFIQTTPSDQDMLIVHLNSWFVADNATIPTGYHVFANYMMIDVPAAIKVRAASDNSLTNQQKDREQMEFRAVNKPRL